MLWSHDSLATTCCALIASAGTFGTAPPHSLPEFPALVRPKPSKDMINPPGQDDDSRPVVRDNVLRMGQIISQ